MISYVSAVKTALLPPGTYNFVVKAVKVGYSPKDPEIPQVELELNVEGQRVWETLTFSEKAAFKVDAFRESLGERVTPGEKVEVDPHAWVGEKGQVEIYVDTFNGKEKNKVQDFLPSLEVKPLPKKAPAVAENSAPDSDVDNIPF